MTTEEKPVEARQLTFKMGDPVPDWLLTLEPAMADAVRGEVTFNVGCDVFDLPAVYVLMPRVVGNYTGLLNITGMGNKLYATGKDVRVCISSQVISGDVFQEANGPVSRPAPAPFRADVPFDTRVPYTPSAEQVSRKRSVFTVLKVVGWFAFVVGISELIRHLRA